MRKCDIWFMRFALAPDATHMCCSNTAEDVRVEDERRGGRAHRTRHRERTLAHKRCVKAVRQTTMTRMGESSSRRRRGHDVAVGLVDAEPAGKRRRGEEGGDGEGRRDGRKEGDEGVDGGDVVTGASGDTIEILD